MARLVDIDSLVWLGLVLPVVAFALGCVGRGDPHAPSLPDGSGDWSAVAGPERFDTETIYSYIDGHAEVYLAYGMMSCLSRRYTGPEGEADIVVDVFEMASSDDAFGVFTVDLDGETVPMGHDGLYRYGWLSYWKGPYFVSVYAEEESEATKNAVFGLGHAVAALIEADADRPSIVADLPAAGLNRRSVRFLRSEQILRTHLYLGEGDVVGLRPDTAAVLAKYTRDRWTSHLMVVDFPDETRAEKGMEAFALRFLGGDGSGGVVQDPAGRWYGARRQGNRLVLAIGAGSEQLAASLLDEALSGGG